MFFFSLPSVFHLPLYDAITAYRKLNNTYGCNKADNGSGELAGVREMEWNREWENGKWERRKELEEDAS